jgi:hypothetical protein
MRGVRGVRGLRGLRGVRGVRGVRGPAASGPLPGRLPFWAGRLPLSGARCGAHSFSFGGSRQSLGTAACDATRGRRAAGGARRAAAMDDEAEAPEALVEYMAVMSHPDTASAALSDTAFDGREAQRRLRYVYNPKEGGLLVEDPVCDVCVIKPSLGDKVRGARPPLGGG